MPVSLTAIPASADGLTTNTTPVDVVASPASASIGRVPSFLNVYNADTVARIFTLQLVSGANTRIISVVSLAAGQNYNFFQDLGRMSLDATNKKLQIKTDGMTTNESPWVATWGDAG